MFNWDKGEWMTFLLLVTIVLCLGLVIGLVVGIVTGNKDLVTMCGVYILIAVASALRG